jgi:hypothetical protein
MSIDHASLGKAKAKTVDIAAGNGPTGDEARHRLEKFGPNAMLDTASRPLRSAVESSGYARGNLVPSFSPNMYALAPYQGPGTPPHN